MLQLPLFVLLLMHHCRHFAKKTYLTKIYGKFEQLTYCRYVSCSNFFTIKYRLDVKLSENHHYNIVQLFDLILITETDLIILLNLLHAKLLCIERCKFGR